MTWGVKAVEASLDDRGRAWTEGEGEGAFRSRPHAQIEGFTYFRSIPTSDPTLSNSTMIWFNNISLIAKL